MKFQNHFFTTLNTHKKAPVFTQVLFCCPFVPNGYDFSQGKSFVVISDCAIMSEGKEVIMNKKEISEIKKLFSKQNICAILKMSKILPFHGRKI